MPPPHEEPGHPPAPPSHVNSPEFQRGFEQGQPYGEKVGTRKGQIEGKKEGDREGYAAGLKDAEHGISNPDDPGMPGGQDPPPPMPPEDPTPPQDPPAEPPTADEPAPPAGDDPAPPIEEPAEPGDEAPPPVAEPAEPAEPTEPPPPASEEGEDFDPEAEALSLYPDLVPRAAANSRLDKARQFLQDPETQKGLEYSAGFAAGFAKGYSQTFGAAREESYQTAFRRGYVRGQADWRRRNTDANGNPLTAEGQYQMALSEFQRGNFQEATDRFDMVLAGGQAGELAAKAMYGKARCLFLLKDYPSARKAAKLLVDSVPESPLADDAAFLSIACLELHKTGGFLGFGKKANRKAAADEFESFSLRYPDSPQAPQALFRLGMLSAALRQKARAIQAYKTLLERFPDHPLAPKARRRLAELQPQN